MRRRPMKLRLLEKGSEMLDVYYIIQSSMVPKDSMAAKMVAKLAYYIFMGSPNDEVSHGRYAKRRVESMHTYKLEESMY